MIVEFLLAALLVAWLAGWLVLEVAVVGAVLVLLSAGAVAMLTGVGARPHDD